MPPAPRVLMLPKQGLLQAKPAACSMHRNRFCAFSIYTLTLNDAVRLSCPLRDVWTVIQDCFGSRASLCYASLLLLLLSSHAHVTFKVDAPHIHALAPLPSPSPAPATFQLAGGPRGAPRCHTTPQIVCSPRAIAHCGFTVLLASFPPRAVLLSPDQKLGA